MTTDDTARPAAPRPGRKRDPALDRDILEAALDELAEGGYARVTMERVAARAHTAKASVYRRWSSRPDLVLDAVRHLGRSEVDPAALPDTGDLRSDLLGLVPPTSDAEDERKMRILAGLTAAMLDDDELTGAVHHAIARPWIDATRVLLKRAASRGEIPADSKVDALSGAIASMAIYRGIVEHEPVDHEFIARVLDDVLLPAVRGARAG